MPAETDLQQALVRRAYERGRMRSSSWRAAVLALPIAVLGWATAGRSSLLVMPLVVATWFVLYWRGGALLRGGIYGLVGGAITALLPLSILRPCCASTSTGMSMGANCCTMPGMCVGAGALVGIVLAAAVPFGKASWRKTAMGMALGMTSVALVKCATLFVGEAAGLLCGLVAGVGASAAARAVLGRRSAE